MIDRYKNCKLVSTQDAVMTDKPDKNKQILITATDKYYTVSEETEHRLDLISYIFYGDVSYWWVIAKASNILNPLNVPIGTVLRIPLIDSIKGLYS